MRILLSISYIKFPVVAGRHNAVRSLRSTEDALDLCTELIVSVDRTVDSYSPRLACWILSVAEDLTYVYHHILHSDRVKITGYNITAIPLGHSIIVEFRTKISKILKNVADVIAESGHTATVQCFLHVLRSRKFTCSEAEAPKIEKRSRSHIHHAACSLIDSIRLGIDVTEEALRSHLLTRIETGGMLEYTEYCGNFYGTPKKEAEEVLASGKNLILEIEVEGARNVKARYPDAVLILLLPPSFAVQEERLRGRATESEEKILERLARTKEELLYAENYDYVVYNHDGRDREAAEEIQAILTAERATLRRNTGVADRYFNH